MKDNKIYRIVCSAQKSPNKILKTIFKPDTTASGRRCLPFDERLCPTITSEAVNRFRPFVYVNGEKVAKEIAGWLNKNNSELEYKIVENDIGYDDAVYFLSNDLETNFVYQRTFGLNFDKRCQIPVFYTSEGFMSLAINCLDRNVWKWELKEKPVLEKKVQEDENEFQPE